MKKFLLATAILAALTGYVSARDDQLPQFYLGKWCMIENAGLVFTREPCHPELELTIRRDGWSSFESTCTFVSVRRTGKFGSTTREAAKKDLIPDVVVVVKCDPEDATSNFYKTVFELNAAKGGNLMMTERPQRGD